MCRRIIDGLWGPDYLEKHLALLEENQLRKSTIRKWLGSRIGHVLQQDLGNIALHEGEDLEKNHIMKLNE